MSRVKLREMCSKLKSVAIHGPSVKRVLRRRGIGPNRQPDDNIIAITITGASRFIYANHVVCSSIDVGCFDDRRVSEEGGKLLTCTHLLHHLLSWLTRRHSHHGKVHNHVEHGAISL